MTVLLAGAVQVRKITHRHHHDHGHDNQHKAETVSGRRVCAGIHDAL
ncbi:MAG: hypothetical protein KBF66_05140 [Rhodoferax sp.]|nr:hypothetical protein [Rhodoferax sp.]